MRGKYKTLIKLLVAIAIVAIIIPSYLVFADVIKELNKQEAPTQPATENLQILSHSISTTQNGNLLVEGSAKNISSSALRFAVVFAEFYDANGVVIGTSQTAEIDLGSGETWNFQMIYSDADAKKVTSYKIREGLTSPELSQPSLK